MLLLLTERNEDHQCKPRVINTEKVITMCVYEDTNSTIITLESNYVVLVEESVIDIMELIRKERELC